MIDTEIVTSIKDIILAGAIIGVAIAYLETFFGRT